MPGDRDFNRFRASAESHGLKQHSAHRDRSPELQMRPDQVGLLCELCGSWFADGKRQRPRVLVEEAGFTVIRQLPLFGQSAGQLSRRFHGELKGLRCRACSSSSSQLSEVSVAC